MFANVASRKWYVAVTEVNRRTLMRFCQRAAARRFYGKGKEFIPALMVVAKRAEQRCVATSHSQTQGILSRYNGELFLFRF